MAQRQRAASRETPGPLSVVGAGVGSGAAPQAATAQPAAAEPSAASAAAPRPARRVSVSAEPPAAAAAAQPQRSSAPSPHLRLSQRRLSNPEAAAAAAQARLHRSGPLSLEILHAFGSHCGSSTLRDAALFGDAAGDCLVHPVGRHLAFRPLNGAEPSFAIESRRVEAVTACAVSQGQGFLASCERCSSAPHTQVSIYDLSWDSAHPLQTLEELGGAVGRLVSAAFSSDSIASLLCLASASPELLLVLLDWRRNLVVARCTLGSLADRVALNPLDSSVVSVSGPDFLRIWVARNGEMCQQPELELPEQQEAPTFTDHAWLQPASNMLVACTAQGLLYLVAAAPAGPLLMRTIEAPLGPKYGAAAEATCIRCFPYGFVVGSSQGAIALWEREAPGSQPVSPRNANWGRSETSPRPSARTEAGGFTRTCTVRASRTDSSVCCLDIAGSRDRKVAVGFQDADVTVLPLSGLSGALDERLAYTPVAGGFHPGPIISLDMAAHRPIIVTACRKESSVRVWNYAARRCDLVWPFPGEEPTGVSVHPLGYFLAVSFTDRLRFMQILVDELKVHRELPLRGIKVVRFSNGGHLLAAAQGKLVLIFSVRTCHKVATLRGHSQQVTGLSFDPRDRQLVTISEDGALCAWGTQTWNKVFDCPATTSKLTDALSVAAGGAGLVHATLMEASVQGPRPLLRTIRGGHFVEEEDVELPSSVRFGSLCHHHGPHGEVVLAGSSTGTLWACAAPLSAKRSLEQGLHVGATTAIRISPDAGVVATGGEDGSVFVLRFDASALLGGGAGAGAGGAGGGGGGGGAAGGASSSGPSGGGAPTTEQPTMPAGKLGKGQVVGNSEVVMINRGEIQVRREEVEQLNTDSSSLQTQLQENTAKTQNECKRRVAEMRQRDQEEIHSLRMRYERLQQEESSKERESLRQLKKTEAEHVQAADQLVQGKERMIRQEADRLVTLEGEIRQLEANLHDMREQAQRDLELGQARRQQELERQMAEKDGELQKFKDLVAFTQHRFDTMLDQEGAEHDLEVVEMRRKHQEELEQQRLIEYKLKKEQDTLLRGLDMMEKDRDRIAREQLESSNNISSLRREVESLHRAVGELKNQQRERESTLKEKEAEIASHKVKVNTLKKFKHVLDFRLREVTLSLQPKDDLIEQLKIQLRELEVEFERHLGEQKQMEATLEEKKESIVRLTKDGDKLRDEVRRRERSIRDFCEDLHQLVTGEQDGRRWPEGLRRIYQRHVNLKQVPKEGETLPMQELGRQIHVMERKARLLEEKGKAMAHTSSVDTRQKTEENQELIKEVEELRVENRALQRQAKDMQLRLTSAEHMRSEQEREARKRRPGLETAAAWPALADGSTAAPAAPAAASAPAAAAATATEVRAPHKQPRPYGGAMQGGKVWKTGPSHRKTFEDRRHVQKLLATADLNQQQLTMQRLEHKLLKDQFDRLQYQKSSMQAAAATRTGAAAGTGLSAVRRQVSYSELSASTGAASEPRSSPHSR